MDEWEDWGVLSGCMRLVVEEMFAVCIYVNLLWYITHV